ncbi:glycosyltransferase family 61 protein [Methylobacterium gregans]|uniref:Glycosyltransferase 61 catalytic domain-containing protein n=1 Tax=Methylobacterium gregans TaxID=374424 RepID=A0AA37MCV5_9HYPH|nr:glycosyltransferase 61 family protein [Methylobacterium gregans]MDQ0519024.1 capsular polysaccharide biosynthesis protein [Methylobacterium gregans]GJD81795.1 hypothetical protein NBEOAGPD_5049 [Methylobacterium gregans]GLS53805.1 hypothetical protein GCM10007886_19880 [Methylobacterium gregans]
MPADIRRCTEVEGACAIHEAPPDIRVCTDLLYVPVEYGALWGLYDGDVRIDRDAPLGADAARQVAELRASAPRIDGRFYYLGDVVEHFGHFVVGSLSRLWALPAGADTPLLYHGAQDIERLRGLGFLEPMLGSLGLGLEALRHFRVPVRLAEVTVAGRAFRENRSASRAYDGLCKAIGRPWLAGVAADGDARPAYLSKLKLPPGSLHKLENEAELVRALERRGVDIVFPEELDIRAQVRLFAERRHVLGLTGSALHVSLFAAPERRILGLNWCRRLNSNLLLFDALNRNRAHYYFADGVTWVRNDAYAAERDFFLRWSLPDPASVAAALVERAQDFDGTGERDAREEAARSGGLLARSVSAAGRRARAGLRRLLGP